MHCMLICLKTLLFIQARDNKHCKIATERVFNTERKNWTICFIEDEVNDPI